MQPLGNSAFEKLHDKDSRSRLVLLNERSSFLLVSLFLCSSLQNRKLSKQNLLSLVKRWRWRHLCLCGGWTSTLWICHSFLQQDLSSGVYFRDFIDTHMMMIIATQDNGLEHWGCVSGCCWLSRSHDPDRRLCPLLPQVGADLIMVMRMVTMMLLNLRRWLMPHWLPALMILIASYVLFFLK